MDFTQFKVLTFDCYGTLIDWEQGILAGLSPVLAAHNVSLTDDEIFQCYGEFEAASQSGAFRPYRTVLREVVQRFGRRFGFTPTESEIDTLADGFSECSWAKRC